MQLPLAAALPPETKTDLFLDTSLAWLVQPSPNSALNIDEDDDDDDDDELGKWWNYIRATQHVLGGCCFEEKLGKGEN